MTPVRLEPVTPQSQIKHSTTEPLRSLLVACQKGLDKQSRPRSDCFWRSSLIRVCSICYSDKHFVNSSLINHIFFRTESEKCWKFLYVEGPEPNWIPVSSSYPLFEFTADIFIFIPLFEKHATQSRLSWKVIYINQWEIRCQIMWPRTWANGILEVNEPE